MISFALIRIKQLTVLKRFKNYVYDNFFYSEIPWLKASVSFKEEKANIVYISLKFFFNVSNTC